MLLFRLRNWHDRYKDLWSVWKNYRLNGLTPDEIRLIEHYRDKGFIICPSLGTFYSKTEFSEQRERSLILKLAENYPEYQEWVAGRFRRMIIRSALHYGINSFFITPIERLQICPEIVSRFRLFGCATIQEIFDYESKTGLWNHRMFRNILRFSDLIVKAETSGYYIRRNTVNTSANRNIPGGAIYLLKNQGNMTGLPASLFFLN